MTLSVHAATLRERIGHRWRLVLADGRRRNQARHACTAVTASMFTCIALGWWETLPKVLVDPGIWSVTDFMQRLLVASLLAAGSEFVRFAVNEEGPYDD